MRVANSRPDWLRMTTLAVAAALCAPLLFGQQQGQEAKPASDSNPAMASLVKPDPKRAVREVEAGDKALAAGDVDGALAQYVDPSNHVLSERLAEMEQMRRDDDAASPDEDPSTLSGIPQLKPTTAKR